jgi:tryptophan-rich sensory protein
MTVTYAILISVGICICAAIFEGACAGKGVKEHFATLRFPKYSAPLSVWYAIGGIYYIVFGFLLYRALRVEANTTLVYVTIGYLVFLMIANGSWNYIFFRRQDLFTAFILGTVTPVFDLVLLALVLYVDAKAALALVPYLLYRVYAVWWGFGLWRENR